MSNCIRQIRRNKLKNELKTNKISEFYHSKYDTLEKRLIRGMNIKENKNNKNGL